MAPTNNNTTWTTPRTWTTGELISASIMQTHVSGNLNALKTPAGGYNKLDLGADITTSSTSFADADSTNLSLTFTTGGGDVIVFFTAVCVNSNANARTYFDIHESVAGARWGGDDGLTMLSTAGSTVPQTGVIAARITGLSAAAHTFKLQWKVSAGTSTLYAGAGTSTFDLHPVFWAFEI